MVFSGGRLGTAKELQRVVLALHIFPLGDVLHLVNLLLSNDVLKIESDRSRPECEQVLVVTSQYRDSCSALALEWREVVLSVYQLSLKSATQYVRSCLTSEQLLLVPRHIACK